jgi:putative membrane-bound dehydrogenase-like protein
MRWSWIIAVFGLCPGGLPAQEKYVMEPGPKSPQESLKCMKPRPGFTVELMAAEPLVMDPIAFAWGPDGKFWVVEMGDYPLGVDAQNKFGGKVKFLEKSKPDGPYDKATVFLDNLGYPTGVFPWGKGVLITCAPDIFYAEDTDGDGKADKKIVLFTGFVEGNQQHRVNGLSWGLDNWIYGANGDSGGVIKCVNTLSGRAPAAKNGVNISGRDFRLKPDTGEFEAATGQSQFGRCRDDWGNWFGCNNSNPCYHFVLDDHYLRRNPHVVYPPAKVPVPEKPGAAPVYPISKPLPRFNDFHTLNHFTSACSIHIYRDDLFGPEFANNTFVCEPVHNLIHREILTPKGVTFTSKRAADEQKSEFLASTDNWFRPTMVATGPDGALWVSDMYRYVIEHPQWIPKDWQKKLDLRAGHDMGRIYRIYPEGKKPRAILRVDKMNGPALIGLLAHSNGWVRDQAQALLVSSKDLTLELTLVRMSLLHKNEYARMHARATLAGFGDADIEAVLQAMEERSAEVRRHVVRLCDPWLAQSKSANARKMKHIARLARDLTEMAEDYDVRVRMQLAYTMGAWQSPKSSEILARLAWRDPNDPYVIAAVLSSVNEHNWEDTLALTLSQARAKPLPGPLMQNLLRVAHGYGSTRGTALVLARVVDSVDGKYRSEQFVALGGLLDALAQRKQSLALMARDPELKGILPKVSLLFDDARTTVSNPKAPQSERMAALAVLGRGLDGQHGDMKMLAGLISPQHSDDLQVAAATSLGRLPQPEVPDLLLRPWKSYGPALRGHILDLLLPRADGLKATLAALEKKHILPFELDAARRQRLLEHKDAAIRARAAKLLAGSVDPDRGKVVESYRPALKLAGDATRGAKIFAKNCAACHKLGDVGQQVGPDLASVGDKSPEGLLTAILDPNQAVEARYIGYTAVTKNGLTHSGLIAAETSTSITLVGIDGKSQVILRTDLEELFSSGKSAMPEGLEKDITREEMADLIEFIRRSLPVQKSEAGEFNDPRLRLAFARGHANAKRKRGAVTAPPCVLAGSVRCTPPPWGTSSPDCSGYPG